MSSSESYFYNVKFIFSPLWMCLLFFGQVSAVDGNDPSFRDNLSSGQYALTFGSNGEDGKVVGEDNGNYRVENENGSSGTGRKKMFGALKPRYSIFGGSGWINGSLKGMEGGGQIHNYQIPSIPLTGVEGGHELPIQLISGSSDGMEGSQTGLVNGINNMTFLVPGINGSGWVNNPLSGLNGSQQYFYHPFASNPWNETEGSPGKRILYFTSGPGSQGGLPQGTFNLSYLSSLLGTYGFTNGTLPGINGFQQSPILVYNSSSLDGTSQLPTLVYNSGPFGGMQGIKIEPGTTNWTVNNLPLPGFNVSQHYFHHQITGATNWTFPGFQIVGSGVPMQGFNISHQYIHHRITSGSWYGADGQQQNPMLYIIPGQGGPGGPTQETNNLTTLRNLIGPNGCLKGLLKGKNLSEKYNYRLYPRSYLNGTEGNQGKPILLFTSSPGSQGTINLTHLSSLIGASGFINGLPQGIQGMQQFPFYGINGSIQGPGTTKLIFNGSQIIGSGFLNGPLKGMNGSSDHQNPSSRCNKAKGGYGNPILYYISGPGSQGGLPQGITNLTYLRYLIGGYGFANPPNGIQGAPQSPVPGSIYTGPQNGWGGFPMQGFNISHFIHHQTISGAVHGTGGGYALPTILFPPDSSGGVKGSHGTSNVSFGVPMLNGYGWPNGFPMGFNGSQQYWYHQFVTNLMNGTGGSPGNPLFYFNGHGWPNGFPMGWNVTQQYWYHQFITNLMNGTGRTGGSPGNPLNFYFNGYGWPGFPMGLNGSQQYYQFDTNLLNGTGGRPGNPPNLYFNGHGWPNGFPMGWNVTQQYLYHQFILSLWNGTGGNPQIPILYYPSGPGNQKEPTLGTTNLMYLRSLFGEAWLTYYLTCIQRTQQLPILMFNSTSMNGTQPWPTLVYPSGPLDGIKGSLQGPGTTNWTFDGFNIKGFGFFNGPLKGLNGSLELPDYRNPSGPRGAEGGHGGFNIYFTSSPGGEVDVSQGGTPSGGFGMNGSENLPYLTYDSPSPEKTTVPTLVISTDSDKGEEESQNGPTGGTTDLTTLSSLIGGSGFENGSLEGMGGSQEYPTIELTTDSDNEEEESQEGNPGGTTNISYFGSPSGGLGMNGSATLPYMMFDSNPSEATEPSILVISTDSDKEEEGGQNGPTGGVTNFTSIGPLIGGSGFENGSLKGMGGIEEYPTIELITDSDNEEEGSQEGKPGGTIDISYFGSQINGSGFVDEPLKGMNGSQDLPTLLDTSGSSEETDGSREDQTEDIMLESEETASDETTDESTTPTSTPSATIPTEPMATSLPPTTSPTPLTPPPTTSPTPITPLPSPTIPSATSSIAPTPSTSTPFATTISATSPSVFPPPTTPYQHTITGPTPSIPTPSAATPATTVPSIPIPFTIPSVPSLPTTPLRPTTTVLTPASSMTAQPLIISPVINLYPMLPSYVHSCSYTYQYPWNNPCLWTNQYSWTSQNKIVIPENTTEKSTYPTPSALTLPTAHFSQQHPTTFSTSASSITSAQSLTVSPIVNLHPMLPSYVHSCSYTYQYPWNNPCLWTNQYSWTSQNKEIFAGSTTGKSTFPIPSAPTLPATLSSHQQPTTLSTSGSPITSAQSLTVSPIVNLHPMLSSWVCTCSHANQYPWANPCPCTNQYPWMNPCSHANQYPWADPRSHANQYPWANPYPSPAQYPWTSPCHFHNHMPQSPPKHLNPCPFPHPRTNEKVTPPKIQNPMDVINKLIMLRKGSGSSNSSTKNPSNGLNVPIKGFIYTGGVTPTSSKNSSSNTFSNEMSCKRCII